MPRFLLSVLLPFLAFLFANNVHNIHGWPIPVPGGTAAKPSGGISLPPELLFEKSCQKLFSSATSTDWLGGCECAAIPRRMGKGTKCCCTGESVELIADSIDASMELATISRIFLFNASLAQLEANSLVAMSGLEEIFIDSCLQLERVDSRAFASLKMLRKIRISNCPKLRRWEAPMQLKHTPRLQTIIARNNDLRALPPLEMESAMPMERLDFSGNCFSQIGEGAMRNVAAKLVLIDGAGKQCLRSIQGGAFRGCRFVTLHLSDNPRLDQLHEDAFAGILHLDHLDLSGSAIAQLPAFGLNPLKRLSLRRVPSLKQLPPVLAFPNLVHADFTYSHHCCFFKYASRDFYARKAREGEQLDRNLEQNYRELRRRVCSKEQQASGGGQITDAADAEADSEAPSHRLRRKERRHVFVQDGGDALFKQLADWYRNLEQQPLRGNAAVNGTAPIGPEPFVGDELGKGVVLARRCDRNAVDRFFLNISCSPQPDALNPCEDIVSNLPLRVIIWPMWLGAIFGNLAVWAVIGAAWQKKMRLHYLFMLNLSLADFLTGVYLALLAFADLRTANDYYNFAVEWQTGSGCAVAGFLSVFASELSIFSMLMIALEIFYNSRFAFYGRQLSGRGAAVALLVGYAYSLGMASLPLLGLASSYQHSSICLPLHIESIADKLYILVGLSLTGLAFGAMVCLYLLLNWTLRHSKASSTTRAEEDRQILRRTLALIGTDMLCWVPTLFFGLTAALGWPLITLSSAKWCLVLFYPINSCANPLLYVFLTRTWRDAKRKAGPLIRRSLAASHPRGTLSWNKLERFYSSGPKSGGNLMRGTGRTAGNGGEEDAEGEAEQRPKTIHCFEGKERRKLLGEVFAGQQQKRRLPIGVRNGRRRASEGDGILGKAAAAKNRKSSSSGPQHSAQENRDQSPPSSSNSSGGQSRKSLLVRPKISAPPQMSDISESSTASLGSSIHQLEPKDQLKEAKKPQMIEKNLASAPSPLEGWQETAKRKAELKRGSVASSNVDGDSGRGDSLRSWAKSARPSVVTLCWDGNQLTDRLLLSRLNCEETTQDEEAEEVGDN